jgi:NhaP-type Na+/H+ or K+/H+ antiporter
MPSNPNDKYSQKTLRYYFEFNKSVLYGTGFLLLAAIVALITRPAVLSVPMLIIAGFLSGWVVMCVVVFVRLGKVMASAKDDRMKRKSGIPLNDHED